MKVLFLDMDGVILSGNDLRKAHAGKLYDPINKYCPPHKIYLLNSVCLSTGCQVVMSSTWRFDEECRETLLIQGFHGQFHEDWRTMRWPPKPSMEMRRGDEIAEWLSRHPEVERYAIVDDDADMRPSQRFNFVRTAFNDGMTAGDAIALIDILKCESIDRYVSPLMYPGERELSPEESEACRERMNRALERRKARHAAR